MCPALGARTPCHPDGRASLYLWHERTPYVGGVPAPSSPRRHHAAQAGVSLGAPFRIRLGEDKQCEPYPGFVVAPGVVHQSDAEAEPRVFVWTDSGHLTASIVPKGDPPLQLLGDEQLWAFLPDLTAAGAKPLGCAGAGLRGSGRPIAGRRARPLPRGPRASAGHARPAHPGGHRAFARRGTAVCGAPYPASRRTSVPSRGSLPRADGCIGRTVVCSARMRESPAGGRYSTLHPVDTSGVGLCYLRILCGVRGESVVIST